jgi:hypothetical protein
MRSFPATGASTLLLHCSPVGRWCMRNIRTLVALMLALLLMVPAWAVPDMASCCMRRPLSRHKCAFGLVNLRCLAR